MQNHASLLYNRYKVSLGILSLQAKESKHTCLKNSLALTNSHDPPVHWENDEKLGGLTM